MAAGGSITARDFSVGCQILPPSPGSSCIVAGSKSCADLTYRDALVAGTTLSINRGTLFVGKITQDHLLY